jgi:hypothetical protein
VIIVKGQMKKITIERVDVIQSGKLINDGQLFIDVLLVIPNSTHIELANAAESIALVNKSRCFAYECGTGLCQ